jgi:tetratricopeptide (TPR) repeat protein
MKGKGFDKLDKLRKKLIAEEVSSIIDDKFFGREKELSELKTFVENDRKRIFCLYGIPMMGKSTLAKGFCNTIEGYKIIRVRFINPENPEVALEKFFPDLQVENSSPTLIVIENFEEALLWKGDHEHLHEIRFPKVIRFLQNISKQSHVKLIIESRFLIKTDPDIQHTISRLSDIQLGKIDRNELFKALNERYRNNTVQYADFEAICEQFNDHVWLIELAMQNEFEYLYVKEAMSRPQSITEQLWTIVEKIINSLSVPDKILLCAFGIVNPMHETELKEQLTQIFSKRDELGDALFSLVRKLLLIRDPNTPLYELNPFLREVCFTNLKSQKEMRTIEQIPFFQKVQIPQYDPILQAQEKGDYGTFYKLIHDLQKAREFDKAHDILNYVLENDVVIKKMGVLNEIGVTYRRERNYARAIETLEKALKIEPDNVKVLNELAIVYKEQKNYAKAIETLEKACELGNIQSFNELAIVYREQKNYTKAIETLEKALIIEPNNVKVLNELAIVYKAQKNYAKAIETLEKACELGNIHSFNVLAIVYREQKNYTKAIETLERALLINVKDVKTLNELAIVYKEQKNYAKAIETLKKGLEIEPNDHYLRATFKNLYNPAQQKEIVPASDLQNSNNKEVVSTVVILTAIKEEYASVRAHLTDLEDADQNDTGYEEGIFEHNGKQIARVIIRECGAKNVISSMEAERAIQYFKPDMMMFVGIAGSWKPQDFKVGDVIFPEKVFYYEGGKSGKDSIHARPDATPTTYTLFELAKKERSRNKWKKLIKGNWGKDTQDINADLGVIASGEQLIEHHSSELGKILAKHFNQTQAVEMEGFGFAQAAIRQGRETDHVLIGIVRGISDIIGQDDNSTTNTDTRPAGNKAFASDTAAAFAFWLIYRYYSKE